MSRLDGLLRGPVQVLNVGLRSFAEPVAAAGAPVTVVDWRPPAEGDAEAGMRVAELLTDPEVDAANRTAMDRFMRVRPMLSDIGPAGQLVPGFGGRMLLHAGPPVERGRIPGPMRGALVGATLFEGWASSEAEAERLVAGGGIELLPAHHLGCVAPMAGVVSPSMPVWMVEDAGTGRYAWSNLNEGRGKVLRFGAYSPAVLERLSWMAAELAPTLRAAIAGLSEPVDLKGITAQALMMGDDCHNRNVAATSLLLSKLAPALAELGGAAAVRTLEALRDNDHFFLNLSMAACKLMLNAAHGVARSSIVTAMARNGVEFGIRLSGTGDRWFSAPSTVPDGLFFPGYSPVDANPDMGDSAITETAGIGGFAMAASPAIVGFVGGTADEAVRLTLEMGTITVTRNSDYQLPTLGFAGTPTGIDARLVVDANTAPVINTGIAHREAGVGQIGAGIARAPLACFRAAAMALGGGAP
ncbi:MAG: DUF1116 domain-containing protein [Acidimicrobiales bacterium]